MSTGEASASSDDLAEIRQRIAIIEKRLEPDEIAKSIDRSYLSINNLRGFLQILSIVITIFVAGAIYFGAIGLSGILTIREEARRVEQSRERVATAESEINDKVAAVDQQISELRDRINNELVQLRTTTDDELRRFSNRLGKIEKELKDISQIFNSVALSNRDLLNAREQQLLTLLAQQIDPDNPAFRLNAAHWALSFRRYDEAIEHLDAILHAESTPSGIRERAKEMRTEANKLREEPQKLQYTEPGGVLLGNYGVVALSANILNTLIHNGLLTVQQAQQAFDASKRK